MSFPLKTVIAAALSFTSFTAAVAGGVVGADEAPAVTGKQPITISSSSLPSASTASVQTVRFAPLKEIVQPLGGATPPAEEEISPLRADDILKVPEKKFASLAEMVRTVDSAASVDEQTKCLATAIYYESRSESLDGQLAVARVIINRVESNRFADSLCGVVKQPGQFSFVRKGVLPQPNISHNQWKNSVAIALIAQQDAWESKAEGALFFHARHVSPSWNRARVAVIDNHVFYR
ncbi:MAG: cell wall hydrolase [Sphingobium sp.]|nr:cell wall hydrolase [Sphingobium sp.]